MNTIRGVTYFISNIFSSNIFLIGGEEITLVDAGTERFVNSILPRIKEVNNLNESSLNIIITHHHGDHYSGLLSLKEYHPTIFVHKSLVNQIRRFMGFPNKRDIKSLHDGDVLEVSNSTLRVIYTPGHSIGSICLYNPNEKILFSGDTVFANGSFGRVDLSTGSPNQMIISLKKLSELAVDILLPGHGEIIKEDGKKHINLAYSIALESLRYLR